MHDTAEAQHSTKFGQWAHAWAHANRVWDLHTASHLDRTLTEQAQTVCDVAMATGRARSKLQRLLKELALDDSTTALPETPVRGAGGEDDAASDEPDSSSVFSSELSSPGGHNVQQAAAAAERYQHLERRAMQLIRALQAKHQQHVVQSEATMSDMRAQYKKALEEMEQRHREVEARAPAVKAKLEDFRGRMQDLRISEAQYQELLAMPEEGLHLVDQIKVRHAWWQTGGNSWLTAEVRRGCGKGADQEIRGIGATQATTIRCR